MDEWVGYRGPMTDKEFPCVTAFFDESGHSASTRVVAMGGAISGPKLWEEVRLKWKAALDRFGVRVFHMTDFENRQGEFSGWDENRKRGLLSELMASVENIVFLMGAAVVVQDFSRLPHTGTQGTFLDAWYFCYQTCFEAALSPDYVFDTEWLGVPKEGANIRACFFEQHRQFTWGPVLFAMAHERRKERGVKGPVGIIGWGSKDSSVHYQFADLIAYELRKHVENAVFNEGRPTRWPMQQLLKKIFVVNVFDNSKTLIPTEGNKSAVFRGAGLADVGDGGRITFSAPSVPQKEEADHG
jgi:hypothetical protein